MFSEFMLFWASENDFPVFRQFADKETHKFCHLGLRRMEVPQISNHNGDINREVRFIYVIDRDNGMPIYFRYVAGNIIDVSTLITTVSELEQYGVSVSHVILDAGYFSEKNAAELFESGIPFMTSLASNKTAFKDATAGNLDDLMSQK